MPKPCFCVTRKFHRHQQSPVEAAYQLLRRPAASSANFLFAVKLEHQLKKFRPHGYRFHSILTTAGWPPAGLVFAKKSASVYLFTVPNRTNHPVKRRPAILYGHENAVSSCRCDETSPKTLRICSSETVNSYSRLSLAEFPVSSWRGLSNREKSDRFMIVRPFLFFLFACSVCFQ